MHTTVIRYEDNRPGAIRIHHNGDFSGNAILQWVTTGRRQGPPMSSCAG